jgi:hypothetical protein
MSNSRAVGAVSSTLKTLLADRIDIPPMLLVQPPVTIGIPPEDPDMVAGPLVNLFLYRICENAALQNQPLPGRGERSGFDHPPLALDLHYLLTAYGATKDPAGPKFEDEIMAHYLLGSAMRILHDYPIVTPQLDTKGGAQVLDPVLVGARESIKLTLQPISLEDLSKVWTALSRPFRAAAAYEVTVVQIEAEVGEQYSQPVGPGPISGPQVRAVTGLTPTITAIHAARRVDALARAGDTLVLDGDGLLGDETRADIAGFAGIGQITSARSDRLTLVVPDDPRLQPGILDLTVSHGVTFGVPPARRNAFKSNSVAFMLVPRVDTVARAGATVTITGDRLWNAGVDCVTLIQGQPVLASQYTTKTPTKLVMPLPGGIDPLIEARVFVRVNGAQSFDEVQL